MSILNCIAAIYSGENSKVTERNHQQKIDMPTPVAMNISSSNDNDPFLPAVQSVRLSECSKRPVIRRSGITSPRLKGATLKCGGSKQR